MEHQGCTCTECQKDRRYDRFFGGGLLLLIGVAVIVAALHGNLF